MPDDQRKTRIAELKMEYPDSGRYGENGNQRRNMDHAERQLQAIEDELKQLHQ
jgi:hypothetical protein